MKLFLDTYEGLLLWLSGQWIRMGKRLIENSVILLLSFGVGLIAAEGIFLLCISYLDVVADDSLYEAMAIILPLAMLACAYILLGIGKALKWKHIESEKKRKALEIFLYSIEDARIEKNSAREE